MQGLHTLWQQTHVAVDRHFMGIAPYHASADDEASAMDHEVPMTGALSRGEGGKSSSSSSSSSSLLHQGLSADGRVSTGFFMPDAATIMLGSRQSPLQNQLGKSKRRKMVAAAPPPSRGQQQQQQPTVAPGVTAGAARGSGDSAVHTRFVSPYRGVYWKRAKNGREVKALA
ncbi:MAG: hypothetical protein VXZ18_19535, partial [Pseudomonadota bacterium]|nr:hypothetical protein [Pseudomonadota bacterium]